MPRVRRLRRAILAVAFAWCMSSIGAPALPVQAQTSSADDSPCDIRTTERVVAVGDIHGSFDGFVAILKAAQLLDDRNRWSGGRAVLVQTGDILDRGADSRKAVDLLRRLERDAQRAGGRVVTLLGNHEMMRIVDDWRFVSPGELDAFRTRDSEALRDNVLATVNGRAAQQARAEGKPHDEAVFKARFLEEVPLGMIEMRRAFGPQGEYGKWIRERATVARVNGIVFLHGGISTQTAPLGCTGINAAVRREVASLPVPPEQLSSLTALAETGPLWYRGLASEAEEILEPVLAEILQQMQARAIVVGHTTVLPGRITARLGGRVIQIDTGMLAGQFFPGGVPSALELRDDKATAIYVDRREEIPVPALQPSVPAASK